jgi:hypothetical protein
MSLLLLLLLLLQGKGMVMPVSMGKGLRRLFSADSLIGKGKLWGMKGAAVGKGYVAAASYGKVGRLGMLLNDVRDCAEPMLNGPAGCCFPGWHRYLPSLASSVTWLAVVPCRFSELCVHACRVLLPRWTSAARLLPTVVCPGHFPNFTQLVLLLLYMPAGCCCPGGQQLPGCCQTLSVLVTCQTLPSLHRRC